LEKWLVLMRILAWELGKFGHVANFLFTSQLLSKPQDPHGPEMILSEPSIIIIWTYQGRMEWMSRILVGEMAGADEEFGTGGGQMLLFIVHIPKLLQAT
jgi:hypothetical protein